MGKATEQLVASLLDEVERYVRQHPGFNYGGELVKAHYEAVIAAGTDDSIDLDAVTMELLLALGRRDTSTVPPGYELPEPLSRAQLRPLLKYGQHAITGLQEALAREPENPYAYATTCAQEHQAVEREIEDEPQ